MCSPPAVHRGARLVFYNVGRDLEPPGKLQEGKGGLELLVCVRVLGRLGSPTSEPALEFATRTDLFANREHVREGIAEALAPFLPPLPLKAE